MSYLCCVVVLYSGVSCLSQVTKGGVHILHLACQYSQHYIVEMICNKLKHPEIFDKDGLNAADYALLNQDQHQSHAILFILEQIGIQPTRAYKKVCNIISSRDRKNIYIHELSSNYLPGM